MYICKTVFYSYVFTYFLRLKYNIINICLIFFDVNVLKEFFDSEKMYLFESVPTLFFLIDKGVCSFMLCNQKRI